MNYGVEYGQMKNNLPSVRKTETYLRVDLKYDPSDVLILTDDEDRPDCRPTKQNILQAFAWLVKDAQINDSFFLQYSGEPALVVLLH